AVVGRLISRVLFFVHQDLLPVAVDNDHLSGSCRLPLAERVAHPAAGCIVKPWRRHKGNAGQIVLGAGSGLSKSLGALEADAFEAVPRNGLAALECVANGNTFFADGGLAAQYPIDPQGRN